MRIHLSCFFYLAPLSIDTINSIEIYHAKFGCYSVRHLSCGLAPVLKALEPCMTFSHFLVYIGVNRHRQLHQNLSYEIVFVFCPTFDIRIGSSLTSCMHRGHKASGARFQSCTGVDQHHNSTESRNLKQPFCATWPQAYLASQCNQVCSHPSSMIIHHVNGV